MVYKNKFALFWYAFWRWKDTLANVTLTGQRAHWRCGSTVHLLSRPIFKVSIQLIKHFWYFDHDTFEHRNSLKILLPFNSLNAGVHKTIVKVWANALSFMPIGIYSHRACFIFKLTNDNVHCRDVIMSAMASRITAALIVYSTVCSGAAQRKGQSSASLGFVRGQWHGKRFHLMTSTCFITKIISAGTSWLII